MGRHKKGWKKEEEKVTEKVVQKEHECNPECEQEAEGQHVPASGTGVAGEFIDPDKIAFNQMKGSAEDGKKKQSMPVVPSQLVAIYVCKAGHKTKGITRQEYVCIHCSKSTEIEGYYENDKYVKI